eukprot:1542188-Rhodomonas_salina.2
MHAETLCHEKQASDSVLSAQRPAATSPKLRLASERFCHPRPQFERKLGQPHVRAMSGGADGTDDSEEIKIGSKKLAAGREAALNEAMTEFGVQVGGALIQRIEQVHPPRQSPRCTPHRSNTVHARQCCRFGQHSVGYRGGLDQARRADRQADGRAQVSSSDGGHRARAPDDAAHGPLLQGRSADAVHWPVMTSGTCRDIQEEAAFQH